MPTMVCVLFSKDFKMTRWAPNIGARVSFVGGLVVMGFSGFLGLILLTTRVVLGLEWGLGGVGGEQ